MKTADIVQRLDEFFRLDAYPADDFAEIEAFCHEAGIPLERYVTPEFMRRHNGLMLRNAEDVECVYTLVFPADEVLAEVERRAAGSPALILTHHPMDFETSRRGLLPVGEASFQRLRDAGISLYSAHAPLDCHDTVSTSRSLARAEAISVEDVCAGYHGGHAGVMGTMEETTLNAFVERLRAALEVDRIDVHEHGSRVRRIAVVAGGAAFPPMMQEAIDRGCDTYLTGDFRVRHGGPWAEEHRPQFDAFVESAAINLIGGSHYATEALVLRHEMLDWFNSLGLPAEFVSQKDAWR
ncbi:MAG TPA: Nif3-like dinuclear metal center hexameric protein [Dehalococcoidia bacterium]|nr:Nif3-like dinuclear metal center hexameric protein [Dehalococcoidia bacterium]